MASEREDEVREDRDIDERAREEEISSEQDVPSDVDAMGRPKRRTVVGGQYGATVRKQLTVYGIALAIVALIVIGGLTVVSSIDSRDRELKDTGPWTEATATQEPPRDLDFIRNGPLDTIPVDEINRANPPEDVP